MASPLMPSPSVPVLNQAPAAPTPNDQAIAQAKLANLQALMARSGRSSTMLSQGGDTKFGG